MPRKVRNFIIDARTTGARMLSVGRPRATISNADRTLIPARLGLTSGPSGEAPSGDEESESRPISTIPRDGTWEASGKKPHLWPE